MDRFAFLRAALPGAQRRLGAVGRGRLLFEGAACFLDEEGRVLYFTGGDDSTQLSFTAHAAEKETPDAPVVHATFDGGLQVLLRPEVGDAPAPAASPATSLVRLLLDAAHPMSPGNR